MIIYSSLNFEGPVKKKSGKVGAPGVGGLGGGGLSKLYNLN